MVHRIFRLEFLSDVIVNASGSTEGTNPQLNYIPGSKFLGIAASTLYDTKNIDRSLDLFHNGMVRFGQATPVIDLESERTFQIPFTYYRPKTMESEEIYKFHELDKADWDRFTVSGIQLKQERNGIISDTAKVFYGELPATFHLKSAQDQDKRRSRDKALYSLMSLPKGILWSFMVSSESAELLEIVSSAIAGDHYMGKSRNAQFGAVRIFAFRDVNDNDISKRIVFEAEETILLYAESDLVFYDRFGQPTATPEIDMLLGPGKAGDIQWGSSQIRSRWYHSWNGQRNAPDASKALIERGSVFVVSAKERLELPKEFWTGSHLSEGFGKMMVNPDFLKKDFKLPHPPLEEFPLFAIKERSVIKPHSDNDRKLLKYLRSRVEGASSEMMIYTLINEFRDKNGKAFKDLSPSQWGMVRVEAQKAESFDQLMVRLFGNEEDKTEGVLGMGQREVQWRRGGKVKKLEHFLKSVANEHPQIDSRVFLVKLCSEMSKLKSEYV